MTADADKRLTEQEREWKRRADGYIDVDDVAVLTVDAVPALLATIAELRAVVERAAEWLDIALKTKDALARQYAEMASYAGDVREQLAAAREALRSTDCTSVMCNRARNLREFWCLRCAALADAP